MEKMIERVILFEVNGKPMQSFLCTPDSLGELAVGFLLSQRHIKDVAEVTSVDVGNHSVSVRTKHDIAPLLSIEERIGGLQPCQTRQTYRLEDAKAMMEELLRVGDYYGTHCLGLRAADHTYFREDVGRHNAMDKVIGRAAMDGVDFSRCIIAATGRISLEMLLKAATMGVPMIVSKKYPSDLSQQIAENLHICIVGNLLSKEPVVYSAQERIDKFVS